MRGSISHQSDLIVHDNQSKYESHSSSDTNVDSNITGCQLAEVTEDNNLTNKPASKQLEIEITGRPVKMHRFMSFGLGPGGIPLIKETTIIETEASIGRVLHIICMVLVHAIVIHFFLRIWSKYHKKSFYAANILVIFLFPPVLALLLGKFVLLGIWTAYISCIIVVSMSALKRPVKRSTPRKVYLFFQKLLLLIYVAIAVNQVGIVISFFCQINFGIGLFFYLFILSVYLGLLSSEAVRILSGKMATNTGYYSEKGAPTRILRENLCPLCGDEFYDEIKLTCGHSYHAACIKGWSFLAKREFCPMCRENVPIKNLITDKWMRGEIYFSDFLGLMRNFIVVASFIFVLYLCFPWLY